MKGFIEVHDPYDGEPVLVNINYIERVKDKGLSLSTTHTPENSFYNVGDRYDEMKRMIEEASAKWPIAQSTTPDAIMSILAVVRRPTAPTMKRSAPRSR